MHSATLVLSLALLGLSLQPGPRDPLTRPNPLIAEQMEVLAGNTAFALDLYKELGAREGNLFFAPQNISIALAMTYLGASGKTAEEMASALHFTAPEPDLHRALATLMRNQALTQTESSELYQGSALWGQKDYQFLDSFVSEVALFYDAPLNRVDFIGATEQARAQINDWVAKTTRDRISELLKEGDIDPATALVLTSAIYFKGQWARQFDPEKTRAEDFFVSDEKAVKAQMMMETGEFPHARTDHVQILELPYAGNELSMFVVLPNERGALAQIEAKMSPELLNEWLELPRPGNVRVELPRFSMSTRFDLSQTLSALGMKEAFLPGVADFSRMSGDKELFISAVIHEANIDVTEEGTEAAAATGVVISRVSMPPTFRADHPFLTLIRHNETGAILFFGRVSDPTAN